MQGPASIAVEGVAHQLARKRRGLSLFLLTLTYFFSYMDRQILAILQEDIIRDLRLSDLQMGLIAGFAFALFYAGLGMPVAWLADRTNRVRIIAVALAIWSGFTALGGLAMNFWHLLLARVGVGIGEAGSSPPSHSIIADLYPPEKRAGAMALYSLGVGLGGAFGTMIGGTVAHFYGWRVAMFVIGLPGVLLALIVWMLVPEPPRGMSDAQRAMEPGDRPRFTEGFRSLFRNPAAVHLVMAFTITSTIGYGHSAFGPSFLIRSFGFNKLEIATYIAPFMAVLIAVAAVLSGRLADRLAKTRGLHAQSYMVAIMKMVALPFSVIFYLSTDTTVAIVCYFIGGFFAACYLGPTFALIQSEAPLRQRAMWAAIALFVNNLIGLGIGPPLVGWISDVLKPTYGQESLRYAMFFFAAITPWAIFHYWRAGVLLRRQTAATGGAAV